ncbi:MAG: O-antigen ligase family protein [Clostridia bacterium]
MIEKEQNTFAKRYLVVLLFILLLQVLFTMSPSHQQNIEPVLLWPAAIALLSFAIYHFHHAQGLPKGMLPALCMVVWMYATRMLNGDPYLQLDLHFMLAVLLGFGVFYPAFQLFRGASLLKWFGLFAKIVVCLLSMISCLALYCTFTSTAIKSPFAELELSALAGRLYVFSMHPNEVACTLSIGFFLAIYTMLDAKQLWAKVLWAFSALCLWLCVATTVTRTVMITISAGMGMLAFLLVFQALAKRRVLLKTAISTLSMLCAAAICFGLFSLATNRLFTAPLAAALTHEQAEVLQVQPEQPQTQAQPQEEQAEGNKQPLLEKRNLMEDMSTFTGRKQIWQAGLQALQERPVTLLIGMTDAQVARVPIEYANRDVYHMHNAWMETLLLVGIPGLLLYFCFMLRIGVCSVKLFFKQKAPISQRSLSIIPAILMVNGMMEIYPSYSGKMMDLLFFLVAGAVVAMASAKNQEIAK